MFSTEQLEWLKTITILRINVNRGNFLYFSRYEYSDWFWSKCFVVNNFTKLLCVKISRTGQKLPWKIATETSRSLSSRLNMMRVGRVPELLQRIILFSATCRELLVATPVRRPILAFFVSSIFCAYYKLVAFAWQHCLISKRNKVKFRDSFGILTSRSFEKIGG